MTKFVAMDRKKRKGGQQVVTVKCGLHKQCRDNRLFKQLNCDVLEMSRMVVEASIYIHFMLMRGWARNEFPEKYDANFFTKYFYAIRDNPMKPRPTKQNNAEKTKPDPNKYKLDDEYKSLRGNLKLPNAERKSNQIRFAIEQYETLFHNNIFVHTEKRIGRFFSNKVKLTEKDKEKWQPIIGRTMKILFYREEYDCKDDEVTTLLNWLKDDLDWNGDYLHDLEYKNEFSKHV